MPATKKKELISHLVKTVLLLPIRPSSHSIRLVLFINKFAIHLECYADLIDNIVVIVQTPTHTHTHRTPHARELTQQEAINRPFTMQAEKLWIGHGESGFWPLAYGSFKVKDPYSQYFGEACVRFIAVIL